VLLPEVLDDSKWLGGFDGGFLDKGKKSGFGFALYVTATIYVNHETIPESQIQEGVAQLEQRGKRNFPNRIDQLRQAKSLIK